MPKADRDKIEIAVTAYRESGAAVPDDAFADHFRDVLTDLVVGDIGIGAGLRMSPAIQIVCRHLGVDETVDALRRAVTLPEPASAGAATSADPAGSSS